MVVLPVRNSKSVLIAVKLSQLIKLQMLGLPRWVSIGKVRVLLLLLMLLYLLEQVTLLMVRQSWHLWQEATQVKPPIALMLLLMLLIAQGFPVFQPKLELHL
ncbi:hypothetical protein A9J41_13125 [Laribacter hongkongensis]|nr:hypothetical protein [Laribacter hongkongensis]